MKKLSILITVAVFMLASCKKDSSIFLPNAGQELDSIWVSTISEQSKISELTKSIIPAAPLTDSVVILPADSTGMKDTTIIRRELFDIVIPPDALKGSVTSDVVGKINFVMFLLRKKGDYIRLQQSTISNDRSLLNSGGGFFLRFFRGNEELNIAPGKNILVRFNDPAPLQNMKVYYGPDNVVSPIPSNFGATWTASTTSTYVKPIQRNYNTANYYGYEILTDKLKWVNAGLNFSTGIDLINLSVFVPDLFSNANTEAYIVFKDTRTVVKLTGDVSSRKFVAEKIPLNKSAVIVTISKVSNDYFLGTKEIITSDKPVEVKPLATSLDAIIAHLNSL
ncbi:MAG TPA: hypothetical protein VFN30_12150 [Chitinophagaceae bacterium]|nr:hypothetical protein [Chitinophagaceae bacterium]